ncbi:MAG: hypothetical protein H0U74_03405 [Bradymonadaceae bacterium]|nr:hypothetical protein [Lujinxingiaceae bacterium]
MAFCNRLKIPDTSTTRPWLRRTLALFFVALSWSAALAHAQEPVRAIKLSEAQKRVITSGGVSVDMKQLDTVNRGEVVGLVKAPISEVWPVITDCGKYEEWRDSIVDTGVVRKESDTVLVCKGTARVPFPASNRHGHFRVTNLPSTVAGIAGFTSAFKYIEGSGNLSDMFGYWLLQPYEGNEEYTVIKYVLNVDIGGWLPDFLVRWASRRVLPDTIHGVRMVVGKNRGEKLKKPTFWE